MHIERQREIDGKRLPLLLLDVIKMYLKKSKRGVPPRALEFKQNPSKIWIIEVLKKKKKNRHLYNYQDWISVIFDIIIQPSQPPML